MSSLEPDTVTVAAAHDLRSRLFTITGASPTVTAEDEPDR